MSAEAGTAAGVVVLSTVPNQEEARAVAGILVKEQLAACVNVVSGLTSIYTWKGEVQEDEELLLVIKTTPAHQDAVIARIQEVHSYDCPEAIALPIVAGSAGYLAWLEEVTK